MTSPLTISAPYLFLFFVVTVGAQDFNEAIQAAEERLAQKIEDSIASKDAEIALLKQRLNVILLIYKVSQQVPNNFIAIFQVLENKATKVIFSAMKGPESGTNFYGDITYDHLVLNLGNGFNIENGIFTVPISGTYRFSFAGQSARGLAGPTYIYIKKNGAKIYNIWDGNGETHGDKNISYTWLMNLTQNDKVNLHTYNRLYARSDYPVIFTGELIHF